MTAVIMTGMKTHEPVPVFFLAIIWLLSSCSAGTETESVDGGVDAGPHHDPWLVVAADELPSPRDWVTVRGIIHAHSTYSHDACDDEPFIDGVRNEQCFEQLRAGMCQTRQDFVFLTDHSDLFASYEYPDLLQYQEGDSLIERGGIPTANRVDCGDGHQVIVAAGLEQGMMPIGLEHHLADDVDERLRLYDQRSESAVRALQAAGALVFLQHTEGWDPQTIIDFPIDGIECFNLHFNMTDNMEAVIPLLLKLESDPESLGVIELALLSIFKENQADLLRWSKAVLHKPLPAILATDVHRNTFPAPTPDGERIDSYRRMMHWFSNYVLLPAGPVDDLVLKQAIAHGRMYGAFDYLGYPEGFDFYAQGSQVYEMGDQVPVGEQVELRLQLPVVHRLDPAGAQPIIRGRILKANDGVWEEVAEGFSDLVYPAAAGVYRAEVRINPEHLRRWTGSETEKYIRETVWIYANPIYVGMDY